MTNGNDPESQPVPAPGMTVTSRFNAQWGSGTVLMVRGESASVLFTNHPARKPVTVPRRSLVVTRAGNWEAAVQAVRLPERPTASRSTRRPSGKRFSTTTQDEAIRSFLERYPGGFIGEAFISTERDSKWSAHLLFEEHLGGAKLAELLGAGRIADAAQLALQAEQKTNLLSVFEKARLSQALRDEGYAAGVLRALADVLSSEEVEEKSFARYLDAVQALPPVRDQRTVTWPIVTILPFLARPERHLFLKPRATQAAAERLQFDLQYQATPNWNTYQRALKLAEELKTQLSEHGCRDLIDVQSFIMA